jgi:hypothetical protein
VIGSADLMNAVSAAWTASGLDALFVALGGAQPVLNDQEARPGQAFPYCVLDQLSGPVKTRMSGAGAAKRAIRDVGMRFNVHAKTVAGDGRKASAIAAYLAEEVMKVFGGHPTTATSAAITLDNGHHLITQYQDDFGIRTGDDEHQWVVVYNHRVDVPVAN